MAASVSILDLPDDISLQVFGLLTSTADLWRVLGVCKAWRSLAADSSFWRAQPLTAGPARWMLRTNPTVQFTLELIRGAKREDPLREVDARDLGRALLQEARDDALLREGLRRSVVHLIVGGYREPKPGLWGYIDQEAKTRWENFRSLFDGSPALVALTTIETAMEALPMSCFTFLPHLERMSVREVDCEPEEIARNWPRLRSLRAQSLKAVLMCRGTINTLEDVHIDEPHASEVAFYRACPNLRTLVHPNKLATDQRILSVVDLPALTRLQCCDAHLYDAAGTPVWNALSWSRLRELNLTWSGVIENRDVEDAAGAVAELHRLLAAMSCLEHLSVKLSDGHDSITGRQLNFDAPTFLDRPPQELYPRLQRIEISEFHTHDADIRLFEPELVGYLTRIMDKLWSASGFDWESFWRPLVVLSETIDPLTVGWDAHRLMEVDTTRVGYAHGWQVHAGASGSLYGGDRLWFGTTSLTLYRCSWPQT